MNAKEIYQRNYQAVKCLGATRWHIDNGYGKEYEVQALTSYRQMIASRNGTRMTFRQFIDCLEAARCGLAYATRNIWFFIVNGDELQFTKEECARFARYFSEGFHMNLDGYSKIVKAGGCYINPRLFEDDEVFPLKANKPSYERWIIGKKVCDFSAKWVISHYYAEEAAKNAYIPTQADYDTEQSDINAEISMQRYGV